MVYSKRKNMKESLSIVTSYDMLEVALGLVVLGGLYSKKPYAMQDFPGKFI